MITLQQQIHSYHLALSLILLILTVYPYLFHQNSICGLVAAYSDEDFGLKHHYIEKFDIIENDISIPRSISTRSTSDQQLHESERSFSKSDAIIPRIETLRKVQFHSFGRQFRLVLGKSNQLITDDFTIITLDSRGAETLVPYNRNDLQILDGRLEDEKNSTVTASFNNSKLMTAQIRTPSDTYVVEPTYLHKQHFRSSPESDTTSVLVDPNSKLYDKTLIVYNLRDHKHFQLDGNHTFEPDKLCASVDLSDHISQSSIPDDRGSEDLFKYKQVKKVSKREIEFPADQSKDKTRCTLHLVADYLFYKYVGNGDLQTTINYLLALINRVNQIYLPTTWDTGDDRFGSFDSIGFTVQNITIHQEYTRLSSGDIHYNMQSDKVWGAREFLDNFSRHSPPRHYCLAHLLTYRQFDSPVLGLAYVASTRFGTIGGICSPVQQKGDAFYKHNTGISTSKGIGGETLITRQADLVLAHELGHNLGAEHDSNECRPPASSGGAYLMHPYAVMGFEKNNRFLSNCSRLAIGRVIKRKASTCFVGVIDNVCGNGVVEDGEECDGGDVGFGHNDPCCDSSCHFTPGSQCSDRHSWCCSKCRIVTAGSPCRPAEEFNCKQSSYCNGTSAECPLPPPVEDDRVCVGRGLCRGGECVPFCEARELHSCLCTSAADACKLCCKTTINGTCVPYDNKAPYLPDGVLCYQGVCEKGRCEQPIQDVIERLWDVIEDINFNTLVKFLRDNIIIVVLVISIPIWCLITHFINEFDKRIKQDVVSTIFRNGGGRKAPIAQSPFMPRLFVGDDLSTSADDLKRVAPLPQGPRQPTAHGTQSNNNGNRFHLPPHAQTLGFRPPGLGFQLPEGEDVAIEPRGSIVMNSIGLPHPGQDSNNGSRSTEGGAEIDDDRVNHIYSTQV